MSVETNGTAPVEPFLRWAGGKRWLATRLAPLLKERLRRTFREPFLGAGAMFLSVQPERAALSDINDELIVTWRAVQKDAEKVIARLRKLSISRATFDKLRSSKPRSELQRAVRFIYLNRTCYGGLYRTNKEGYFNVPYGGGERTPQRLWEDGLLDSVAHSCKATKISLRTEDFESALGRVRKGDVCYLDPTFSTRHRVQFDRYNPDPFTWEDQKRLARAAQVAAAKGCLIVLSNVHCRAIRELYQGEIQVTVTRQTGFGRPNGGPRSVQELLVVLDTRRNRSSWTAVAHHASA